MQASPISIAIPQRHLKSSTDLTSSMLSTLRLVLSSTVAWFLLHQLIQPHKKSNSLLHSNLPLNLLMKAWQRPHLITLKNILPRNTRITTLQNLLMNTRSRSSKNGRSPFTFPSNLQLHTPSNRLRDPKGTSQPFHLEGILRLFPFLESVLQRVGAVRERGGLGGCGGCDGGSNACAQRVVDSRGGGRAEGVRLQVGMGCRVVGGGCDSHCLGES
jgi:hypothetical protein